MGHLDELVLVDPADQITDEGLDIQPLEGGLDAARHAAQLLLLLHQVDLEALVGETECGGHPGHAAADYEGRLVDRQLELLERLETDRPRHRHADDVLGLPGGLLLLLRVHPGAMLPDVGHVEEVLVDPSLAEGVAEQRLVGPGRASSHHHPVEPLLADGLRDLGGGIGGADKEPLLGMTDVIEAPRVLHNRRYVDDPADVRAAVTGKDTDPGLLVGDIPLFGIDPLRVQHATT